MGDLHYGLLLTLCLVLLAPLTHGQCPSKYAKKPHPVENLTVEAISSSSINVSFYSPLELWSNFSFKTSLKPPEWVRLRVTDTNSDDVSFETVQLDPSAGHYVVNNLSLSHEYFIEIHPMFYDDDHELVSGCRRYTYFTMTTEEELTSSSFTPSSEPPAEESPTLTPSTPPSTSTWVSRPQSTSSVSITTSATASRIWRSLNATPATSARGESSVSTGVQTVLVAVLVPAIAIILFMALGCLAYQSRRKTSSVPKLHTTVQRDFSRSLDHNPETTTRADFRFGSRHMDSIGGSRYMDSLGGSRYMGSMFGSRAMEKCTGTRVYVCYAHTLTECSPEERHQRHASKLGEILCHYGIVPLLPCYDVNDVMEDVYGWFQRNAEDVDAVIVMCSPRLVRMWHKARDRRRLELASLQLAHHELNFVRKHGREGTIPVVPIIVDRKSHTQAVTAFIEDLHLRQTPLLWYDKDCQTMFKIYMKELASSACSYDNNLDEIDVDIISDSEYDNASNASLEQLPVAGLQDLVTVESSPVADAVTAIGQAQDYQIENGTEPAVVLAGDHNIADATEIADEHTQAECLEDASGGAQSLNVQTASCGESAEDASSGKQCPLEDVIGAGMVQVDDPHANTTASHSPSPPMSESVLVAGYVDSRTTAADVNQSASSLLEPANDANDGSYSEASAESLNAASYTIQAARDDIISEASGKPSESADELPESVTVDNSTASVAGATCNEASESPSALPEHIGRDKAAACTDSRQPADVIAESADGCPAAWKYRPYSVTATILEPVNWQPSVDRYTPQAECGVIPEPADGGSAVRKNTPYCSPAVPVLGAVSPQPSLERYSLQTEGTMPGLQLSNTLPHGDNMLSMLRLGSTSAAGNGPVLPQAIQQQPVEQCGTQHHHHHGYGHTAPQLLAATSTMNASLQQPVSSATNSVPSVKPSEALPAPTLTMSWLTSSLGRPGQ